MCEKVLGFKQKNATSHLGSITQERYYHIKESELVPVVSLEWLKNLIKKEKEFLKSLKGEKGELKAFHEGQYTILKWVIKKAKKEAEKIII